ncbi:pentapeptide repeat-containing protein [Tolypothrix sp. NIES-4075]|uniref:pentapeptide repeat-containing protein n=1 Tax=Tolypothrix sp. NIES-4075 TaxID=2005459 RepID=UPI00135BA518|nr:pentapeptide repeat-containing protein [Tolypothrix sp. NIES-4075]
MSQESLQPELHNLFAGQPILIKACLFLIVVILGLTSGIVSAFFGSWYSFNITLPNQEDKIEFLWMILIIITWLFATINQGIGQGLKVAIIFFIITLLITDILAFFNLIPTINIHIYPVIDHSIQHLFTCLVGMIFAILSFLTGSFAIATVCQFLPINKINYLRIFSAVLIIITAIIASIVLYFSGGLGNKPEEDSYLVRNITIFGGIISGFGFGIVSLIATKFSNKHPSHFEFLHSWAIAAASWGGTSFYNLDLSNVDLTNSELANTDFRARKLYRTCLKHVKGLDRARIDNQYLDLSNPQVQKLLIDGYSEDTDFSRINLQGAYLRDADMRHFKFIETNLNGAYLQDADLRGSILVRAQVTGVDFTSTNLTGICIEDWSVNSKTCFAKVECDYIYRKLDEKGEGTERYPVDRNFEKGEFEALYQEVEEVVELVFKEGVNWRALSFTFRQLQLEDEGLGLELKGVEKRGELWVVKVTHKEGIPRQEVEQRVIPIYNLLEKQIAIMGQQLDKALMIGANQSEALKELSKKSFGNNFSITGSTITNLAGSGEINYDEAASKIRSFVANGSEPSQATRIAQSLLEQFQNQNIATSADEQAELIQQVILNEAKKDPIFKQFIVQQGQQIADNMPESTIATAIREAYSQLI